MGCYLGGIPRGIPRSWGGLRRFFFDFGPGGRGPSGCNLARMSGRVRGGTLRGTLRGIPPGFPPESSHQTQIRFCLNL